MSLRCGIVGLPNVGKSTIFNALTKSSVPSENYPFCTIEQHVGIVSLPDSRLDKLTKILSQRYIKRNGGYSRVIRAGYRYGDDAPMAVIELVDRDKAAKKVDVKQKKEVKDEKVDQKTTEPKKEVKSKK